MCAAGHVLCFPLAGPRQKTFAATRRTRRLVATCHRRKDRAGHGLASGASIASGVWEVFSLDGLCNDFELAIFQRWHIVAMQGCPI